MRRCKGENRAIRVYTVCDESRYLIVRNIPALGCGDDLLKLFSSYGEVEECKPMDAEECEEFTDVYWIKFRMVSNARFAKRKLDEYVFMGNKLQVSYAPHFETLSDTKLKLESRIDDVLSRLNPSGKSKGPPRVHDPAMEPAGSQLSKSPIVNRPITRISSDQEYFPSQSMNQTVKLVREKLDKIQSSANHLQIEPASKKTRIDNRRRI